MSESDRRPAPPGDSLRITALLALAHGGLFLAAFPPINLWPASFVSVAPLAWLAIHATSARRVVLSVMAVHLLVWLWLGRWLVAVTVAVCRTGAVVSPVLFVTAWATRSAAALAAESSMGVPPALAAV